jgi:hypothetical protein
VHALEPEVMGEEVPYLDNFPKLSTQFGRQNAFQLGGNVAQGEGEGQSQTFIDSGTSDQIARW